MYALIQNNQITRVGPLPRIWWDGDRVSFEGANYESLIDGNSWSPSAYPAGWKLVGA